MNLPEFVKYIHAGRATYFRLTKTPEGKPIYYRDGGKWDMSFEFVGGHLVAKSIGTEKNYWDGLPLIDATEGEYVEDNRGYVPDEWLERRKKPIKKVEPTPDMDWNRLLAAGMNEARKQAEKDKKDQCPTCKGDCYELGATSVDDVCGTCDGKGIIESEAEPILRVAKGEYFHICDSNKEEFYFLRALKDFEVLDKGSSPWDLVTDLEQDGFVELLPDQDAQDGIDFAWE